MTRASALEFGKIGVLMGGTSSERSISLKSGNAIVQALKRQSCDVRSLDLSEDEETAIMEQIKGASIDVAFIALHGSWGEDGTIQSVLDKMGIPYTGSDEGSSKKAFDKITAQNLFKGNEISIPAYVTIDRAHQNEHMSAVQDLGLPLVIKPSREGSSMGITIVEVMKDLPSALDRAWEFDQHALAERYIKGRELTVGILGDKALPVVEICPSRPYFDFDAKYTKGLTEYIVPAQLPAPLADQIRECALKAHRLLGCADFSRVDFMLDENNAYYVLELNTIPGFTETSLLPMAAAQTGIDFDHLCLNILEFAHAKKEKIKNTTVR